MAEAFGGCRSRIGDGASVRAATRVNLSKPRKGRCAGRPNCNFGQRLIRVGEMSEDDAQSLHRGTGGAHIRKARATREAPERGQG